MPFPLKHLLPCLHVLVCLAVAATASPAAGAAEYDLLITGGKVVDGSGNAPFTGDVAISKDRIVAVGPAIKGKARRTVSAAGLVIAPGFIDMLGQSEDMVLIDPRAESKVFQGITTEITGEGSSIAPVNDLILKQRESFNRRYGLTVDWSTIGEYFDRLARTPPAINIATFVGATTIRKMVLGYENREPKPDELERMRRLVGQAMEEGALGLSSALTYAPANFAKTEELKELAKVAARFGGIYATHIRNEGNGLEAALREAMDIGKDARIPVEIFHLKVAGSDNWGKMGRVVTMIEEARNGGLDISANQYPYTAAATSLDAAIPPWAHEGGGEKFLARLGDPAVRTRLKKEILGSSSGWDNWYRLSGGADGVMVHSVFNRNLAGYEGKTLAEIARLMKKEPLDALFDLILADNGCSGAIYFVMAEEDLRRAMVKPWVGFCCDSGAASLSGILAESKRHPRAFGSFPRVLGRYVREEKLMSLQEAVRRMTSRAAARVGLRDRGLLKEGFFADVVVFDETTISDRATYTRSNVLSSGIRYLVVNGQLVIDDGRQTKARPGRGLKKEGVGSSFMYESKTSGRNQFTLDGK